LAGSANSPPVFWRDSGRAARLGSLHQAQTARRACAPGNVGSGGASDRGIEIANTSPSAILNSTMALAAACAMTWSATTRKREPRRLAESRRSSLARRNEGPSFQRARRRACSENETLPSGNALFYVAEGRSPLDCEVAQSVGDRVHPPFGVLAAIVWLNGSSVERRSACRGHSNAMPMTRMDSASKPMGLI
jgi:hypothetical protein